jgi:hypothetical protein
MAWVLHTDLAMEMSVFGHASRTFRLCPELVNPVCALRLSKRRATLLPLST